MFLQIIIQYFTTYQAVQFFCIKQEKVVTNTHKHLPYRYKIPQLSTTRQPTIYHGSHFRSLVFKMSAFSFWLSDPARQELSLFCSILSLLLQVPRLHNYLRLRFQSAGLTCLAVFLVFLLWIIVTVTFFDVFWLRGCLLSFQRYAGFHSRKDSCI